MAPLEIVAVITPKEGKADRIQELLIEMAKHVETNEPNTLRYHLVRENPSKSNPNPCIVVIEKYTDMAAIREHGASKPFKAFGETLQKEGLVGAPMKLIIGTGVGGFEDRSSKL